MIEFVDIAGLIKGASKGEGLGNDFLTHIRNTDAIAHVVRFFIDDDIIHVNGKPDPMSDFNDINTELILSDITTLESKLEEITAEKKEAIKKQKFELAASLRDNEKKIISQLDHAKNIWEKDLKEHRETVSEENVADVVSIMTGIPVNKVASQERKKLSLMTENIKSKIIGQNEAVQKIVRAIRRNRVGLKDPNKPIGSFIFLGPTGVGKTQLAKALSAEMFDSQESLMRVLRVS